MPSAAFLNIDGACACPSVQNMGRCIADVGETWANESARLHVAFDDRDAPAVRAGAALGSALLVPGRHRLAWSRVLWWWWRLLCWLLLWLLLLHLFDDRLHRAREFALLLLRLLLHLADSRAQLGQRRAALRRGHAAESRVGQTRLLECVDERHVERLLLPLWWCVSVVIAVVVVAAAAAAVCESCRRCTRLALGVDHTLQLVKRRVEAGKERTLPVRRHRLSGVHKRLIRRFIKRSFGDETE